MSTNQPPPRAQSRLGYDQSSRALQANAQQSTALTIRDHQKYLEQRLGRIKDFIHHSIRPEAMVRFVLRDMDGEAGEKLRACTTESIYLGLLACAVTGLEPGALKGEAFLVPYWNSKKKACEAQFQRGYKGVIKMALRSRFVKSIRSNVVYEGDLFEVDQGTANSIVHRVAFGNRGKEIIAAYAIARLSNGETTFEVMDREDLDAVRKAGNDGPAWKDWPDQMYRKAPVHRLGKFLQFDDKWHLASALDNAKNLDEQRAIIDVETSGEGHRAELSSQIASEMAAQAGDLPSDEAALIAAEEAKLK